MLERPAVLLDFSTSHYLGLAGQHCITTSRENRLYGLMDSTKDNVATIANVECSTLVRSTNTLIAFKYHTFKTMQYLLIIVLKAIKHIQVLI